VAKLRRDDQRAGSLGAALSNSPGGGVEDAASPGARGIGTPPGSGPVETPRGPARIELDAARGEPRSLLILGHGAGGDVAAPDLLAVRNAVTQLGVEVVRVTQPYRVAGRRAPAPAAHLDEAWCAVVSALRARQRWSGLPLIVGGRSSGARVACRTAVRLGAAGVVALAFPEHPPGKPDRSRGGELRTGLPTLVVNGDRDPFGLPDPSEEVELRVIPGADHSLRRHAAAAADLVAEWLSRQRWARTSPR
jgi:predicted alpha/beta-hydrolase family hydrolase